MLPRRFGILVVVALVGACDHATEGDCDDTTNLASEGDSCGTCGTMCADGLSCIDRRCQPAACEPGATESCYSADAATQGIGRCHAGTRTCAETGTWSACADEVIPAAEICNDGIDNNCSGAVDEDVDLDGDGFTTCGGDCCDSVECSTPALVNAGAFDVLGNGVDDDCDSLIDNPVLFCDQGIASSTTNAQDFARAIDLCQTATPTDRRWGVLGAELTLASGTGTPDPAGHAVRPKFGENLFPRGGVSLMLLSTGAAAAKNDTAPAFEPFGAYAHSIGGTSAFPADFVAANGGRLPNAPRCPNPYGDAANDSEMLVLQVRVPTNARSFKLSSNFFSAEFPEYICTQFNDFFVVLLDSTFTGALPNPADKNLAFFQPPGTTDRYPVGVNLAHGNTGLFTQCKNGDAGCRGGNRSVVSSCSSTAQLAGTGFDDPYALCNPGQLMGGATGWLETTGNVVPGEIITIRIAVWDTSDPTFDSLVAVDGFQWSTELSNPGTIIGRY